MLNITEKQNISCLEGISIAVKTSQHEISRYTRNDKITTSSSCIHSQAHHESQNVHVICFLKNVCMGPLHIVVNYKKMQIAAVVLATV